MADTQKKPPQFLAWGLYSEHRGRTVAMEWRELGPVAVHDDGSGGYGHFKSFPSGGWNHRFTFRRNGEGPPPLPTVRPAPPQRQQQQPNGDDEAQGLFGDGDGEP